MAGRDGIDWNTEMLIAKVQFSGEGIFEGKQPLVNIYMRDLGSIQIVRNSIALEDVDSVKVAPQGRF